MIPMLLWIWLTLLEYSQYNILGGRIAGVGTMTLTVSQGGTLKLEGQGVSVLKMFMKISSQYIQNEMFENYLQSFLSGFVIAGEYFYWMMFISLSLHLSLACSGYC